MKALLPVFLLVAMSALLAGCESTPAGPVTPEFKDGAYVIHLVAGNHFSPANAKVPLNATVRWVADDGVHDVTAQDGSWTSDAAAPAGVGAKMKPGDTFEHRFAAAGTYDYACTIHESTGMKGTITVG